MKQLTQTLTAAIALTMIAAACQKTERVVEKPKMEISAQFSQDAESLALAGEQLMTPSSFMLADHVLSVALEKDPGNQRAQLYKMLIQPAMKLKGAATRIRPLVRTHGDQDKYEKWISEFPNSTARDFFLDGAEDIKTAVDAQNLLVQYRDSLVDFYNWMRTNHALSLTVNLNPWLWQEKIRQDSFGSCEVIQNDDFGYEVVCDHSDILQTRLSPADLLALRQMVAGKILYMTLFTSYSAEGTEEFLRATNGGKRKLSPAEFTALADSIPNSGKLRGDHGLNLVSTLGADFAAAWKYAMENQTLLCPSTNYPKQKKRKGYVFENGICVPVDSEAEKNLALLNGALKGPITVPIRDQNGQEKEVTVDSFAVTRNPVQDLKSLLPSEFNSCGKATALRDKTLGGVFPNGDAEANILATECN